MDCIFCKIINNEIPSTKVYEDDFVYAFKDINPQAPVHIVIIPKKHFNSINDIDLKTDSAYIFAIFSAIQKIAEEQHLENGFRIINNCGRDGAQSVLHLHFHLLGGCQLSEKIL